MATAALKDIRLATSQFNVDAAFFGERRGAKLDFNFGVEVSEPAIDTGAGSAISSFSWKLEARAKGAVLLSLQAKFVCTFENLGDISPVAATNFIREAGRFGTYPYFRALASQMSWASGADLPILPIYTTHNQGTPADRTSGAGREL